MTVNPYLYDEQDMDAMRPGHLRALDWCKLVATACERAYDNYRPHDRDVAEEYWDDAKEVWFAVFEFEDRPDKDNYDNMLWHANCAAEMLVGLY